MDSYTAPTANRVIPPHTWGNRPGAFLESLKSPWYVLVADLYDIVTRATMRFGYSRGLKAMQIPLTTRTVTCPNGLGSDSEPVGVEVSGVRTFLSDSAQFPLEYGCRLTEKGCYTILPSFRNEVPDNTHLSQFSHSEAEIVGGLEDVISYVEAYVRYLTQCILEEYRGQLIESLGNITHLERMASATSAFPRVTFEEASEILNDCPLCIQGGGSKRSLTREGELRLMARVSEFVWLTNLDHLTVPFYQAFADADYNTASCADLLFGVGEVVGSGERHTSSEQVQSALELHKVPISDYAWYVGMKREFPLRTAGFGMGVERYLLWVLDHDDIRDLPLISRVDEVPSWPTSVDRP